MSRARRRTAAVSLALVAAACSGGSRDEPGAVSADEARQLNEAAAMLDANSVQPAAVATPANGH